MFFIDGFLNIKKGVYIMAKISIDNPPLEVLLAMQDDQFREILKNDEVLNRLEEEKNNKQAEYF